MKHKELKELKKLFEKEKISEKTLKKGFELLEKLSKSNKSDFKEAEEFCTKLIKKQKLDKKTSKKIKEKLEKLSKALKKQTKETSSKKTKKKEKIAKQAITQPIRVTKTVMVQTISQKASLTKKDANVALNSILETITESLTKGDNVTLIGFGKFSTDLRAERDGFNPFSREKIRIPEHKIAKFTVGAKLKQALK